METRTITFLPDIPYTICSLSPRHFWRVGSIPSGETPPAPPEGYTLQQALDNVTSFRERYEQYNVQQNAIRVYRALGSARILARELPQFEAEKQGLVKLCLQYSYLHPDNTDDPVEAGVRLNEMLVERAGDPTLASELYLWLQEKAGGIDHAAVDEILKRLRPESQRDTPANGSGVHPGAVEAGAPDAPFDLQPAV